MNPETSPFHPGQPVPVELFAGRGKEVEQLRGMIRASQRGVFKIGFVSGEQGIGKSSLAMFARRLAEHDGAMGCHVFLGGARALDEMLHRTFDRILKESVNRPWLDAVKNFFDNRMREAGLFGITLKLDVRDRELADLRHDFASAMGQLLERVKDHKQSIFLILDDIDSLSNSAEFANWLKSTVDEIATSGRGANLCVLLVGPEERRYELAAQQPSLARVFELIRISPWSDEETTSFYRESFQSAGAGITEEGLQAMVNFTGGLPVLAHEIGDAVWRTAEKPEIGIEEVFGGIAVAAEVVGAIMAGAENFPSHPQRKLPNHTGQDVQTPAYEFPAHGTAGALGARRTARAGQLSAAHEETGRTGRKSRSPRRLPLPHPTARIGVHAGRHRPPYQDEHHFPSSCAPSSSRLK